MVDTLMDARHIVPSAYRDPQKECTDSMYFILILRFELFLGNTLGDISDEALTRWAKATAAKFTTDAWPTNFTRAMLDLIDFSHRVTTADIAPEQTVHTVPQDDHVTRGW